MLAGIYGTPANRLSRALALVASALGWQALAKSAAAFSVVREEFGLVILDAAAMTKFDFDRIVKAYHATRLHMFFLNATPADIQVVYLDDSRQVPESSERVGWPEPPYTPEKLADVLLPVFRQLLAPRELEPALRNRVIVPEPEPEVVPPPASLQDTLKPPSGLPPSVDRNPRGDDAE
jgi:hypothetical protein